MPRTFRFSASCFAIAGPVLTSPAFAATCNRPDSSGCHHHRAARPASRSTPMIDQNEASGR
jgi:hypothetical protein